MPVVAVHDQARAFVHLTLADGEVPRLWIDLISYVVMAGDQHTYRLVQDTGRGRETLFESRERNEVADEIIRLIALRTVERERELAVPDGVRLAGAGEGGQARAGSGHSTSAVVLAGLAGFAMGAAALFVAGIWLARLP